MIHSFTDSFIDGLTYVRKHPQLLMTMLLIAVIPVAFLVSGQQFLSAAKENQESLEKNRIGIMHDMFSDIMLLVHFEPVHMQTEIEKIVVQNPDITKFMVLHEEKNDLIVVASLETERNQTIVENPELYRISNIDPDHSIITPYVSGGVRYWQSFSLVQSTEGERYYIFIETSLKKLDTLFAARILEAYYWLAGILAIILFLIARHVRLIDYSYLYSEIKRANEMKDLFTNMVAHELRAPLTAIRGYASLIHEDSTLRSNIREDASRIEESAERLVLIVSDLLDVARIHSGKLSIKNDTTDVKKVINSVLLAMQSSAHEKNITLAFEENSSDISIQSDEKRMYQALTNLVSNSIKYTHAGTITVSLKNLSDRIEIRVKDTGMGISSENQKKLFAPFFRVENTEVNNITGTGLGMWITKQLIELMKGSIAVESIRGVGTHIVITLPR